MTVSERWVRKLETLRAALSHSHPSGRAEEITEYALDLALEHVAKKNRTAKPRRRSVRHGAAVTAASASASGATACPVPNAARRSRRERIPADVYRTVMQRDQEQCQWRLHDGSICGSKIRLQIDHIVPAALGGATTAENLRILCAAHNQLAARRVFGDVRIAGATSAGGAVAPRGSDGPNGSIVSGIGAEPTDRREREADQ
jgi:5-methylcytosine-specific restriction endonuclease McrA